MCVHSTCCNPTVPPHVCVCAESPQLVKLFPPHVAGARLEAAIAVFGRILRLEKAVEPLRYCVPRVERRKLLTRLGWLNALTPDNPDAYYVVDLEVHEERYCAIMLVELAVAEPGENWEGETFNGITGWELPMSWTKEVPLYVVGGAKRSAVYQWVTHSAPSGFVPHAAKGASRSRTPRLALGVRRIGIAESASRSFSYAEERRSSASTRDVCTCSFHTRAGRRAASDKNQGHP